MDVSTFAAFGFFFFLFKCKFTVPHSCSLLVIVYGAFESQNKGCEGNVINDAEGEDRSCLRGLSGPQSNPALGSSPHPTPPSCISTMDRLFCKDQSQLSSLLFKAIQLLNPAAETVAKGQTSPREEGDKVTGDGSTKGQHYLEVIFLFLFSFKIQNFINS